MTLDTSEDAMWGELDASERLTERHCPNWEKMVGRYSAGDAYDRDVRNSSKDPENPAFELVAAMKAQIVAGNPQLAMQAMRTDRPLVRLRTIALKHTANRLSRNMRLKRLCGKLFIDFEFWRASTVLLRKRAPWADPGPLDGPPWRPYLKRVPPDMLRYDARAMEWEDTRWRGYGQLTSKSGLEAHIAASKETGWRLDKIAGIKVETGLEKLVPHESQGLKHRDDFMLWCVWVPEEQVDPKRGPDQGYWGTWHYYAQACTDKAKTKKRENSPLVEIRDPQPCFGSRTGPFTMFGQYYVPSRVEPLSQQMALEHVIQSLCMRSKVMERAIKNYKRVMLEGTGTRNLANLIKNAPDLHVIKAKGFNKGLAEMFEIAGPTATLLAMAQWDRDRFERLGALSATQSGNPRPNVTATADALAAGGTSARVADKRDTFYDGVTEALSGMVEMVDADDDFYMPLSPEAQREMGVQMIGLQGGREEGDTFEDYEIELLPLSMKHQSEEERQAASDRELEMWMQIGPGMIQNPHLDFRGILNDRAVAYGNDALAERVNYRLAAEMAAVMFQMQMAEAFSGGEQQPKPVSAKDAGVRPPMKMQSGAKQGARVSPSPAQPLGAQSKSLPGGKAGARASKSVAKSGAGY